MQATTQTEVSPAVVNAASITVMAIAATAPILRTVRIMAPTVIAAKSGGAPVGELVGPSPGPADRPSD